MSLFKEKKKKQKGGIFRPPPIWGGYKWGPNGNMVSILRNQRGGFSLRRMFGPWSNM